MVDPLTVIGNAASVAGIIEALAKTVSTLHELHSRWKQADFAFINLIAQLTALKAALTKLEEWMETGLDEGQDPHHQLVMDLEVSVTCCRMLTHKMDSEISELHRNADNSLASQSKVKLMVKNGTLEELQKMVERQTSALTLLLTVCNCKAISNQKILLEKSSTRKVIRRVKDDTSSLYVQRDSTSLHSRVSGCSDTLSKISKAFEFDRELFISKVYERALRGSLKDTVETLRRQASPGVRMNYLRATTDGSEKRNSQSIDHQLEEESKRRKRERRRYLALVLGDVDCARAFLNESKILYGDGFTTEELQEYKAIIRDNVRHVLEGIESILGEASFEADDKTREVAQCIHQELRDSQPDDVTISDMAVKALQELWASEQMMELLRSSRSRLPISAEYFIREIQRLAQKDYIPTTTDILNAKDRRTSIRDCSSVMRPGSIRMFDVSGQRLSETEKWIQHFKGVAIIIFFVDLGGYNEVSLEDPSQTRLQESLEVFKRVANSRWSTCSSFILLLSNWHTFQGKLGHSPLSNYFPAYTGGDDSNKALKYITKHFRTAISLTNFDLYSYIYEMNDYTTFRLVFRAVWQDVLEIWFRKYFD